MSLHPPLLAACMVTYESAHVAPRALEALRAAAEQAGIEVRLVVADNASTDGSAEAAERAWPGATVLRHDSNLGYAPAMNRAIEAAEAAGPAPDWYLLLNPDTAIAPEVLRALAAVHPRAEIAVFTPLLTDEAGRPVRTAYRWPALGKELARLAGAVAVADRLGRSGPALPASERRPLPEPLGAGVLVDYPVGACLFVRRSAWRRVGPFDDAFVLYHEEMEWCWRAAARGIRPWVLPRVRAVHLRGQSARRRPPEAVLWQYRGLVRFYEKHRTPLQQRALRAALAASFGARAAAARTARRPEQAAALWEVARMAARGEPALPPL